MAGACLVGILARIAQAHNQHRERMADAPVPAVALSATTPLTTDQPPTPTPSMGGWTVGLITIGIVGAMAGTFAWWNTDGIQLITQPTVYTPLNVVSARAGDGWRVTNTSASSWRLCTAEVGVSKARIADLGPNGSVTLTAQNFTPPLKDAASTLQLSCAERMP